MLDGPKEIQFLIDSAARGVLDKKDEGHPSVSDVS